MSTTPSDLRQNAQAARAVLASYTLPEEVAQILAASQLNLDAAANLLDEAVALMDETVAAIRAMEEGTNT